MKKVLFLIFASLLVLGACGNNDSEKKEDKKSSEHKKSNDTKKDKKSDNKKDNSKDEKQAELNNNSDDTTSNETQSTSKNDNGKAKDSNGRPQGKQAQVTQQNNQQQSNNNQNQQNNKGYMTQAEIDEWNRTKPTTHDESQMGYGHAEYEEARKASAQVWDDPNAHAGGPIWVGKNEGYDSWARRQQEVQESQQ